MMELNQVYSNYFLIRFLRILQAGDISCNMARVLKNTFAFFVPPIFVKLLYEQIFIFYFFCFYDCILQKQ